MAFATAFYHDPQTVSLAFPYSKGLVEDLKVRIPVPYRTYNPETKIWTISGHRSWARLAADLLLRYFPGADIGGEPPANAYHSRPTPIRATDPDFAALHLLPSAPAELVGAAYKLLAKRHHPDLGGSTQQMQAINAAYERLQARGAA